MIAFALIGFFMKGFGFPVTPLCIALVLGKLFETFDQGYDLVYGYYPEKKHNWFRNLGSKFNDLTINMMINKTKDVRTSSYFLVRKFVRDDVIQYEGS